MRKILTLDIETSPHLCYSFQTWNTNILPAQILEPTRVIGVGTKWHHENRVNFFSEYEGFPRTLDTREECHRLMVVQVHALMDEADVVVTYNGDKFDLPHLAREFHLAGLRPPAPFISVDLYKVIKKNEIWMSHKLGYITEALRLAGKLDNSGWELWKGVLSDDPQVRHRAWLEMRRYCKRDVFTTDELLIECLPLITNLPSPELYELEPDAEVVRCPGCEGTNLHRRGFAVARSRRYPRYQCQDCGKWSKGSRSEGAAGNS